MKRNLDQVHSIHEVPYNAALTPHVKKPTVDIIPVSSIEKSAPKQKSSPCLFTPEIHAPAIVKLALRNEVIMNQRNVRLQNNIEQNFERNKEFERETMLKIKEAAGKTQDWNFWKKLQDIGALVIAAISTIVGFFFVTSTSATFLGAAMIASGILSIANFVFEHNDVWDQIAKKLAGSDEDLQKKIRSMLPIALSIVSSVLALGGTASAVFLHSLDLTQKFFSIGQTASHLIQGSLIIGTGIHESRAKMVELALDSIKIETTQVKFQLESAMQQLEDFCQFINKFIRETHLLVKATLNTIQVTQQPV